MEPPCTGQSHISPWDRFTKPLVLDPSKGPLLTVLIPSFNEAMGLQQTIDTVRFQHYSKFEILVLDASSTDATPDIVRGYEDERIELYTVAEYHLLEILNLGVSFAKGRYCQMLHPGDLLLSPHSLTLLAGGAIDHSMPDLIYAGSRVSDEDGIPKVIMREMSLDHLKKGQQPTSLQACWFRSDTLKSLGRLDLHRSQQVGLDLFCRYALHSSVRAVQIKRVVVEHEHRKQTYRGIAKDLWETLGVIHKYFGGSRAFYSAIVSRDLVRMMALWFGRVRRAFIGK